MKRPFLCALLLLGLAGSAATQSLGEVAEREKAKRKSTGAKSYTDDDLNKGKPSPSPSPAAAAKGPAQPAATGGSAVRKRPSARVSEDDSEASEARGGERESSGEGGDSGAGEGYWRGRVAAQNKIISAADAKIPRLQARIDELRADLNPMAGALDPNRELTRQGQIRDAQQELETAKADLAKARRALEDIREEARLKRVRPEWVQ